jgi:hypothetical protein
LHTENGHSPWGVPVLGEDVRGLCVNLE